MPLVVGATFAGYTVDRPLGRGGMAAVWQVWEGRPLNRRIALKVLPQSLLREPGFAERMNNEAAILASLEHPSIVPVYRAGIDEDTPWIGMRLLPGGSVADLARSGRLPLQQILKILGNVADALDHAHAQRDPIVHRDVKPANVLLDAKGHAYLSDFGIAELVTGTTLLSDTLMAGRGIAGTAPYMPPEQSAGRAVSQSDVYALGIMTYELLTGRLPFTGRTYEEIVQRHQHDQVPIPSPDLVSAALMRPILKALEKDASRRWLLASEFVAGLKAAAQVRDEPHPLPLPSYQLHFGPVTSLEDEEIQELQAQGQMPSGFLGMRFQRLDGDFEIPQIEVRLFAVDKVTEARRILSKKVSELSRRQHVFFKSWEVMNDGTYEVQIADPASGSLVAMGRFEVISKGPAPEPRPLSEPSPKPTPPTPPSSAERHPAESRANTSVVVAVLGVVMFFTPISLASAILAIQSLRLSGQSGHRPLKRAACALAVSVLSMAGGVGFWYPILASFPQLPGQGNASPAVPDAAAPPSATAVVSQSVDGFSDAVNAIAETVGQAPRAERMCGQLDVASFSSSKDVHYLAPPTIDVEAKPKTAARANNEWAFLTTAQLLAVLNGNLPASQRTAALRDLEERGGPYVVVFQADKRSWPVVPIQPAGGELGFTSGEFEGWIIVADLRTRQLVCEGTLSVSNSQTVKLPPGDPQTASLRSRSAVFDDFRARFTEQAGERLRTLSAGQLRVPR